MAAKYRHHTALAHREIRLIDVQCWTGHWRHDEIRFSLSIYSLDTRPEYVALSYAWGDPTDTLPGYCDGVEFALAKSLYTALLRLRNRDTSSLIWIDVICINQDDLAEKSQQVQMMREIYFNATATIIWLGEKSEDDIVAMNLMRNLNACYPDPKMMPQRGSISDPGARREFNHLAAPEVFGLPPMNSPEWGKLFTFYRKPWFSRVWIIQELCASRQSVMWCGDVPLQPFVALKAAEKIFSYPGLNNGRSEGKIIVEILNAAALADLQEHYQRESSQSILLLLRLAQGFKATIAHDRLFALFGIADDGQGRRVGVSIDYRRSMNETLTAFMRWALEVDRHANEGVALGMLSFACYPFPVPDLPTWVPAWHIHGEDFSFLIFNSHFKRSGLGDQIFHITDGNTLGIRGKVFDRITETMAVPPPLDETLEDPQKSPTWGQLKHFFTQAKALSRKAFIYDSPVKQREALIRTMCLDCGGLKASFVQMSQSDLQMMDHFETYIGLLSDAYDWNHTPMSEYIPWKTRRDSHYISGQVNLLALFASVSAMLIFRRYPRVWWQWVLYVAGLCAFDYTGQQLLRLVPGIGNVEDARKRSQEVFPKAWPVFENYAPLWPRRSLCLTNGGRLGLPSIRAQRGDKLCVFDGCGLVFILRSVPGEDNKYRLISDAHVHGCMQGEIHDREDLESEDIAIV